MLCTIQNINAGMRRKPVSRVGPRSVLHFSVSSTYSTRIQPSLCDSGSARGKALGRPIPWV
jgi:hypothetical protein